MKFCPTCLQCYEDVHTSCVEDKAALVSSCPGTRLIAQKYCLERLLSNGCRSVIYAGTQLDTDFPVAIKLFLAGSDPDPEAVKWLRREAHAIAHLNTRINHQHVAKTYDYGLLPDGTAYIAMELVAGQTLREYLDSAGPLPLASAVRIARQVAEGLEVAHRCGVVHCDLEPSNIIVARDYYGRPEAKVINFGFAKLQKQITTVSSERSGNSNGNSLSGVLASASVFTDTSHYMSPERCAGGNLDERSDIYSLGVILYEMLAGRLPFDAPKSVAFNSTEEQLPPLKELRGDVPEPLAQIVAQALYRKPSMRLRRAAEVARQLRAIENPTAHASPVAPSLDVQTSTCSTSSSAVNPPSHSGKGSTLAPVPTTDLRSGEYELKTYGTSVLSVEESDMPVEEHEVSAEDDDALTAIAPQIIIEEATLFPAAHAPVTSQSNVEAGVQGFTHAHVSVIHVSPSSRIHPFAFAFLVTVALALGIASGLLLSLLYTAPSPPASTQSPQVDARSPQQPAPAPATVMENLAPTKTDRSAAVDT